MGILPIPRSLRKHLIVNGLYKALIPQHYYKIFFLST